MTEFGVSLIGMVNKNTKVFFKYIIENLTKDWLGGYYLVLRSKYMVPRRRPLISIGYKYNERKVLYVIITENAWSTQAGFPILDQFSNVSTCPVACPLAVYKFFDSVNEVDSHNKSRQSGLAL